MSGYDISGYGIKIGSAWPDHNDEHVGLSQSDIIIETEDLARIPTLAFSIDGELKKDFVGDTPPHVIALGKQLAQVAQDYLEAEQDFLNDKFAKIDSENATS